MLRAEHISKQLGGRQILDDVDFAIAPSQIVALLGPSGCGKTSLLRALSLLAPPDSGRLSVGERNYEFPNGLGTPWQTLYPELTVVFQQFPLWPHLRIRHNLLLPLELHGEKNADGRMSELCDELGLTPLLHLFPMQLSVGQRQRAALVRALLPQPKYLLLDEVTSAQDVEHIKRMIGLLKKSALNGTAIVLATHLIRFARGLAERFYFIDEGRIVERG